MTMEPLSENSIGLDSSIIIDAPVEDVWSVLTDFATLFDWGVFVTDISGEKVDGATINVTLRLGTESFSVPRT